MTDFIDLKQSKLYATYCHSANPIVSRLMQELENALGKEDINKLEPIESLLGSEPKMRPSTVGINIDNILSKMKTTPTHPAKTVIPDVDGILSKIDCLMAAIETHEKLPTIDVEQIIKKFTLTI